MKSKPTLKLTVNTMDDLREAAKSLLDFAGNVKVFAFYGDLGAGKTTFIKEICKELGVAEGMSSPTFAIVNEYVTKNGTTVYHFDFYRIKSIEELKEIGVEEYFDSGEYCFIEWPEKIINLLPEAAIRIDMRLEHNERLITFSYV